MSFGTLLRNSAWAAIAAATVITALPATASAQDRRGRTEASQQQRRDAPRVRQAPPQRAQQAARRTEQRAARVERRTEQRAAQVERRGNQAAAQAARRGQVAQARQVERRTEQGARQIERRGDQRAQQVRSERNTTYAARTRNPVRLDDNRRWNNDRRDNDRQWNRDRRDNDRRWSDNRRGNDGWRDNRGNHRQWDRRWRDNNRYDWQRYRARNRVVFNIGTYYAPYRSYSYRRLGIGYMLDSLFFGSRYWINDPWQYRLPEVYGPYRWVRYYDDVLLVDIYSGQVVDVIYDFFW